MAEKKVNQKAKQNNKPITHDGLYFNNILEMKILLLPRHIGVGTTKENLKSSIQHYIEGKCIKEGYVKPGTVNIKTYTSGTLKGDKIEFTVIFECKTYNPAEGSWIDCKVRSVTKAGIHADVFDDKSNIPATVFVLRDHFAENKYFNTISEDDNISVKVIGTRYELNDSCVEILGNLMMPPKNK